MATFDDVRRTASLLPGSEERATTGGATWFVRGKLYAWECHPWPSIPADVREIIAAELVVAVKVPDDTEALALREMAPDVFLPRTTGWGEPKVAFRMAGIDVDHLSELVTEAWRTQAPKYLRRELDESGVTASSVANVTDRESSGEPGGADEISAARDALGGEHEPLDHRPPRTPSPKTKTEAVVGNRSR